MYLNLLSRRFDIYIWAHDDDDVALAADAGKFVAAFVRIISQSVPHL
jgi:hypothetical protein